MNIVKNVSDLKPYPGNPRKISIEEIEKLKRSIREFGLVQQLIVNKHNEVIGGNQRLRALIELGIDQVECILIDIPKNREKALNLALNKISGEWDEDLLKEFIVDLNIEDIELSGFDKDEIKEITGDESIEPTEDEFNPEDPVETLCHPGNIWQLGKHRLMCGDSLNAQDIEKLMGGKIADLVFTDPPYGVEYEKKAVFLGRKDRSVIRNDNLADENLYKFYFTALSHIDRFLKDGGSFYICSAQGGNNGLIILKALSETNLECRHTLIWCKNSPTFSMGRLDYEYQHESILYGWKGNHTFYARGKFRTTVWSVDRPLANNLHPTMKPIVLVENAILNSSEKNDLVLDLFGGSGSTLIACEQSERICCMMEIDPCYCDVIIARWEKYTGDKAVRL